MDKDVWPDNKKEIIKDVSIVSAVAVLLFFGFTDPGVFVDASAKAMILLEVGHLSFTDAAEADGGSVLKFRSTDVEFMNRIYNQRTHEVAYCGLRYPDDRVKPWLTDTDTASPTHVSFDFGNCPLTGVVDHGLIHTHPVSGSVELSEKDEEVLRKERWKFSCVQGGQVVTESGQTAFNLRCYTVNDEGVIEEAPVEIT